MKYVFFDLDGTLTDSSEGITNAVAYSLAKFGINVENKTSLYPFIGPPLKDSYAEFYGFNEKNCDLAIKYYHEQYDEIGVFENYPYEGIDNVLQSIKDSGKKIVLATSKPDIMVDKVLTHFDLSKYFDFLATATMDGTRSTKIEVLSYAISSLNITDMSEVVMVGDRKFDILGAKKFGMKSIGVLYGFGGLEELQKCGADYIAETPQDILKFI